MDVDRLEEQAAPFAGMAWSIRSNSREVLAWWRRRP